MAIEMTVEAEARSLTGKGPARRIRREGKIPATLYGAKQPPVNLAINPKQMAAILHSHTGHNTIFNLKLRDADSAAVMIVDWQREPVKGNLLHVDLKRIAMDQLMRVKVPVQAQGEAAGVKLQGGILEIVLREIEIECLPADIPEHVTIDVTALNFGQTVRAGALALGDNRRLVTDPDRVVLHVVAVKEVAATPAAEVAAEAPAEPEVAKKGKAEAPEAKEGGKEEKKEKK